MEAMEAMIALMVGLTAVLAYWVGYLMGAKTTYNKYNHLKKRN